MNGITGFRAYKTSIIDVIETALYFNLLAYAIFSLYDFKTDIMKQTAVAYTSTIMTFILLVGVIIYHVYLLVRKDRLRPGEEVITLNPVKPEVTHTIFEFHRPHDQSPQQSDSDVVEGDNCLVTPAYQ